MITGSVLTKSLLAALTLAGSLALSAVAGEALARDSDHDRGGDRQHSGDSSHDGDHHDGDHQHKPTVPVHGPGSSHNPIVYHPVHGPGSSHNPIVYHPVHGPGSSHNPIVVSTSKYPPGTVVTDHRNGKTCQYTVGDPASVRAYNKCEYGYSGGHF
jgi:hypothetical protein